MSKASDLFTEGKLDEAIAAAIEIVKTRPGDESARGMLASLLCFRGDFERADKHLEALLNVKADAKFGSTALRQLIRAATARREVFLEGRVPELVEEASESLQRSLQVLAATREGDLAAAAALARDAEAARAPNPGRRESDAFDDFRDLDDVTAGVLEFLTLSGAYYWVPLDRVERIDVRVPETPFNLLWPSAHISIREGTEAEVYVPATYYSAERVSDELTLGRATNWTGDGDGAPVRGEGLKMFLAGEDALPILELGAVSFDGKKS